MRATDAVPPHSLMLMHYSLKITMELADHAVVRIPKTPRRNLAARSPLPIAQYMAAFLVPFPIEIPAK